MIVPLRWPCALLLLWASALPALAAERLPRIDGTDLRVLVWNVSRASFFDEAVAFAQVLEAADADLLILDEMPADRGADDVHAAIAQLASTRSGEISVSYGSNGYNQRSVFVARVPLTPLDEYFRIAYPKSLLRKLRKLPLSPENHRRLMADVAAGVAVHGALATFDGRLTLLVGVDLQCCGDSDDSIEEERRLVETRLIRTAMERVLADYPVSAIVVGGDFNTTRGRAPVALVQGPTQPADTHLRVVPAHHRNGKTWTWDGRGTPFPSRKLDYLLISDDFRVRQALVFDPESMPPAERERLGLAATVLRRLSEHRPQIIDLGWN